MKDVLALLAFGHFPERLLVEGEQRLDDLEPETAKDMYDDDGAYIEPIDEVSARAQAAAMAVRDGLDASMPQDQRAMLYGNASRATRPVGKPYTKTLIM